MLLSTSQLLWLPRSPDPRPAMTRAEKATRTSRVSEQVRSRCFCAHFLHSNRAVALLMPKIRLPQAAEGLLIPSCLFGPPPPVLCPTCTHAGAGALQTIADPPSSIPVLPALDAWSNSKLLPPRARYCRSYMVTSACLPPCPTVASSRLHADAVALTILIPQRCSHLTPAPNCI